MKKLLTQVILYVLGTLTIWAQGTVNFQNIAVGLNAPVFLGDGVTKVSGPDYSAALLAGPSPISLSQIATTTFLSGSSAGYFLGGVQTIPTVSGGGTAFVLIEVWNSALFSTFPFAQSSNMPNAWGQSALFSVITGNPNATPPEVPAVLTGLSSISVGQPIPEPTTLALWVLAGLMLGLRLSRGRSTVGR